MEQTIPKYFRPSITKYVILFILTLGGYRIYWAYRNWDAIKSHDKATFSATWQAVLFIFFIRPLFKRMSTDLKGRQSPDVQLADRLAVLYICIALAGVTIAFLFDQGFLPKESIVIFVFWIVHALLRFGILVYFQLRIFRTSTIAQNNKTARGEIIVVLFFFLPLCFGLIKGLITTTKEEPSVAHSNKKLNIIIDDAEHASVIALSEESVHITLPTGYAYSLRQDERSSSGEYSFSSYYTLRNLAYERGQPSIYQLVVYTESSLNRFVEVCTEECIHASDGAGDGPGPDPKGDLEYYYKLREYFKSPNTVSDSYDTVIFNGRTWVVSYSYNESGGQNGERVYKTIIGDSMVEISVLYAERWGNTTPSKEANQEVDALFSKIQFD